MITAIIPARGGSKGIHRKNLQVIGGKTLVRRAVEKCKAIADRVIVSSECGEIRREAQLGGGEALVRPERLARDESTTSAVLLHARDACKVTGDVLFVQCTAPLVTVEDLQRVVKERGSADMGVLCHSFHGFLLNESGTCTNYRLCPPLRRQDIQPQYVVAGSGWSFDAEYCDRPLYSGTVKPILCPGPYCDIDTNSDLEHAKAVYHYEWSPAWMMS